MSKNHSTSTRCTGQTGGDEGIDTLISHMPQTDAIFKKMAANEHPNFLEVMAALSETVAFNTDCDFSDEEIRLIAEKMSQKKCLFCY